MSKSDNLEPKETIKDRLGFDTGMTQEELVEFKNDFDEKAKSLNIPIGKNRDSYKSHFRCKTNLNKYYERFINYVAIIIVY